MATGSPAELAAFIRSAQAKRHWVVLALDYEFGAGFERVLADSFGATGVARAWSFAACQPWAATTFTEWLAAIPDAPAGVAEVVPTVSEKWHADAVDRVKAYISAGDCYQVNLTFPLEFSWFGRPLDLYRRLRASQPVRFGAFIGGESEGIVSLSPEMFLTRRGRDVRTRPMKGTADRALPAAALTQSEKDRAENLMIVDLLRNDLGRIAEIGSVRVDRLFEIEDYPTVWQMVSEVSATVGNADFLAVLAALFPCGSITGAPKIRAMEIIKALEVAPRGLYTGSLGWLAPNGDFRLNVAIRTLQLTTDQRGTMGVGSGIVMDSIAAAEWQECDAKRRFLQAVDPDLQLIETLRRDGTQYPRLVGHLARLKGAAAALGFKVDLAEVQRRLEALPAAGCQRVRLTLRHSGEIALTAVPLIDLPVDGWAVAVLSSQPISASDPLRRYKTTARRLYDAALASIAGTPDCFDVVFLNERGEVAEGARSNVFVEREGCLLTPPVTSGALPGVLRAELLAEGKAREAVLFPEDLSGDFFLGNALRGLQRVRLRSTV